MHVPHFRLKLHPGSTHPTNRRPTYRSHADRPVDESALDAFERRLREARRRLIPDGSPVKASTLVTELSSRAVSRGANSLKRMQAMLEANHRVSSKPVADFFSIPQCPPRNENAPIQRPAARSGASIKPKGVLPRTASASTLRPPALKQTAASMSTSALAVPRRSIICSLPAHTRKDVLQLFDAFAAQHTEHGDAVALRPAKPPHSSSAAALKASSLLGGVTAPKLGPSRKGFENLLRLYYRHAGSDEIEAMLAIVAAPLDELVSGRWAAKTKSKHGIAIQRIFAKADKDGNGGIDVSEFAASVEAANIDEAHVRAIFDAADKDGNGLLDLDEFVDILSKDATLKDAFGHILAKAEERRERAEHERLAYVFRSPSMLRSPGGRRTVRPSLSMLRPMHEVAMPWHREPLLNPVAVSRTSRRSGADGGSLLSEPSC